MRFVGIFLIVAILLLLLPSCGSAVREVNLLELTERIEADNQEVQNGSSGYHWSYLGTVDEQHHFRRQILAMFRSDRADGVYVISGNELSLGESEFEMPGEHEPVKAETAFTRIDSGPPYSVRHSVDFGVGDPFR